MSAIKKAVDEIKFRIPYDILREAFKDDSGWRRAPIGIDQHMMLKVIQPRVLVDANLVGGQQVIIPMGGLSPTFTDGVTSVYEIPDYLTQNRTIVAPLSVGYMPYVNNAMSGGYGMGVANNQSDVMSAAQRVGDSMSSIPMVSSAILELVARNTISVREQFRVTGIHQLRCIVENDANLNNISPRSWGAFATLCELAIKSYIYNKLIIRIDQAYLQGGQELGAFKSYVENLSDAEQQYQTHLREVWRVTAFCNDTISHDRFLKLQTSGGI